MAKGKFSTPRPYREEEREIEQAFRQVTDQKKTSRQHSAGYTPSFSDATVRMPALEREQPLAGAQDEFDDLFSLPIPVSQPRQAPRESELPRQSSGEVQLPSCEETEDMETEDTTQAYLPEALLPEDDTQDTEAPAGMELLERVMTFVDTHRKGVLVGICAFALALILVFIACFFLGTASDPYNGKILNNVIVAGVNVGGLTKSEAVKAVNQAAGDLYTQKEMTVRLGGTTLTLAPQDTGADLNVKAAVNAAYDYGRVGTKEEKEAAYTASFTGNHTVGLLPYLNLNEAYIRGVLEEYSNTVGSILTQTSYTLEGTVPELTTDVFDPENAPALTLAITMGTPGVNFQAEDLFTAILDAYSLGQFQVSWNDTDPDVTPDPLDLEKVYEEVCVAPVDASVDTKTYEVIPGSYGYSFDLEKAQSMVSQAQYGQLLRVEMDYVKPERMEDEVFFQDVLAECRTPYSNNENRVNNLVLACKALDGLVLNPGETFSYNQTLGERTAEKGYKKAPAYSGLGLVDSIGGGICQVSSTLYCATLIADLETVERHDHGFTVSYIDMGMDATVSWNGPDFKFRNNYNFPIQLKAEAKDNYVTVQILGTDEKDYYIEMSYTVTNVYEPETEYVEYPEDNAEGYKDGDVIQKGTTGYFVRTFKNKYNKVTGELISKDFETYSRYITVNQILVKIIPSETTPPATEETVPPTQPSVTPTEPETKPAEPTVSPTVPEEKPTDPAPAPDPEPTADPAPEDESGKEA